MKNIQIKININRAVGAVIDRPECADILCFVGAVIDRPYKLNNIDRPNKLNNIDRPYNSKNINCPKVEEKAYRAHMKNLWFESFIIIILATAFMLTSCNSIDSVNGHTQNIISTDNVNNATIDSNHINIAGEQFKVCDFDLFDKSKIYMLKSHQEGQMLSIIVKNKNDELVIFDGGRIEDGTYLCDFIKSFGGKVKYWFLTHIHDDHIGAIYDIFINHSNDIYIENLCYNFADFDWYYEKAGNDAGALNLFNDAKDNYINALATKGLSININDKLKKNDIYHIDDIKIKVMNDIYKLDQDPINNTSIVYKIDIEDKSMIVLGDLGYEAGELFYKEYEHNNELKSDIVVMAHHGQGGAGFSVYEYIAPSIALWPTTEYIYENKSHKLLTDDTKKWLEDLGVKENILSYISNYIIE